MEKHTVEYYDWINDVGPKILAKLNDLLVAKGIETLRELHGGTFKDGKWESAPLQGRAAALELKNRGFNIGQLNRAVRFHKGECWNKLWLDKEQFKALEEAVQWRIRRGR